MADDFEAWLYAHIESVADKNDADRFRAKGDGAFLIGDQDPGVDVEDLFEDVVTLLAKFGVSRPPLSHKDFSPDRPRGTSRVYRDFTVGELKRIAETKTWPDDAFTWEKTPILWPRVIISTMAGFLLLIFISVVIHKLLP